VLIAAHPHIISDVDSHLRIRAENEATEVETLAPAISKNEMPEIAGQEHGLHRFEALTPWGTSL
jgi:hypothetical protein